MDGEISRDLDALCPICHATTVHGSPCSERCRATLERDIEEMYDAMCQGRAEANENVLQRGTPQSSV